MINLYIYILFVSLFEYNDYQLLMLLSILLKNNKFLPACWLAASICK